jgi:hypothetical protein
MSETRADYLIQKSKELEDLAADIAADQTAYLQANLLRIEHQLSLARKALVEIACLHILKPDSTAIDYEQIARNILERMDT